ncbi:hypothetical protein ACFLRB_05380 [Acidobacteriota bacterium]
MGSHFAAIRVDLKKNKGLSIQLGAVLSVFPEEVKAQPVNKHLYIIYPVVPLTRTSMLLKPNTGTVIDKLSYVFVSEQELNHYFKPEQQIGNEIFDRFKTLRTKRKGDELYDLSRDVKMTNNLLDVKNNEAAVSEYKDAIATAIDYFLQKKFKILKRRNNKKKLTKKQKKMLESLGYL